MRRIVLWLASTVTIVVLLFGYHTSTDKTPTAAVPAASSPSSTAGGSPTTGPSAVPVEPSTSPSARASSSSSEKPVGQTYTGSVAETRWGPVQVAITVEDGTVTAVEVLQQPEGNPKDVEINAYALPVLIKGTLQAQSADIDMVSGATVTSDGYIESLQSALDQAGG